MPARTIRSTGARSIGVPFQRIAPARGRRRPEMVLSVVVLPAPFEPTRATISPSATVKEIPFKTSLRP
jgi:hypothetical protein